MVRLPLIYNEKTMSKFELFLPCLLSKGKFQHHLLELEMSLNCACSVSDFRFLSDSRGLKSIYNTGDVSPNQL